MMTSPSYDDRHMMALEFKKWCTILQSDLRLNSLVYQTWLKTINNRFGYYRFKNALSTLFLPNVLTWR